MPTIPKEEYLRRINHFLEANSDTYSDLEKMVITSSVTSTLANGYLCDIVRQVYDELGLLDVNNDIYAGFMQIIEENFDLNQDIIEVGAGKIPSLARRIARKKSSGTVTVYDPRLIKSFTPLPNMVLKREQFAQNTPLNGATLLIGFMPCEATPIILDSAIEHDVDFIIGLCEGGSRAGYEWLEEDDEWISTMEYIGSSGLRSNGGSKVLGKASLARYGDDYPVIYSKKRKS